MSNRFTAKVMQSLVRQNRIIFRQIWVDIRVSGFRGGGAGWAGGKYPPNVRIGGGGGGGGGLPLQR